MIDCFYDTIQLLAANKIMFLEYAWLDESSAAQISLLLECSFFETADLTRSGLLILKNHYCISKGSIRITSSHRIKGLQEGYAVSALRECKRPQSRRLDERPGDVPIQC